MYKGYETLVSHTVKDVLIHNNARLVYDSNYGQVVDITNILHCFYNIFPKDELSRIFIKCFIELYINFNDLRVDRGLLLDVLSMDMDMVEGGSILYDSDLILTLEIYGDRIYDNVCFSTLMGNLVDKLDKQGDPFIMEWLNDEEIVVVHNSYVQLEIVV